MIQRDGKIRTPILRTGLSKGQKHVQLLRRRCDVDLLLFVRLGERKRFERNARRVPRSRFQSRSKFQRPDFVKARMQHAEEIIVISSDDEELVIRIRWS